MAPKVWTPKKPNYTVVNPKAPKLYYSPKTKTFAQSFEGKYRIPYSRPSPVMYHSPSTGAILPSFDGETVAPKKQLDAADRQKFSSIIADLEKKMKQANSYKSIRVMEGQDLTPEARKKLQDLDRLDQHMNKEAGAKLVARGLMNPKDAERRVAKNPEQGNSFLNRIIDVLSRPVYAGASAAKASVERGKREDQLSYKLFLDSLNPRDRQIATQRKPEEWDRMTTQRSRGPVAGRIPQPPPLDSKTQQLLKKFNLADATAKKKTQSYGQDPIDAAIEGLKGKQKNTWADVISAHSPNAPNWVKAVGGFTGDVLLDPTTYIPGVALTKPFTAGRSVVRNVVTRTARTTVQRQGDELVKRFNAGGDAVDPQLFDRIVSPNTPAGERVAATRELTSQMSRGLGATHFQGFFNSNLDEAVKAGRVTPEARDLLISNQAFDSVDMAAKSVSDKLKPQNVVADVIPPREGAKQFVSDIMERGRLSGGVAQAVKKGEDASSLQSRIAKIDEKLGSVGLPNEIRGFVNKNPKTRAMHTAHGDLVRWRNALVSVVEKGVQTSSPYVVRSLRSVMGATDKGIKHAIFRALAGKADNAKTEIARIVDEYIATVARPSTASYRSALDTLRAGKDEAAQAIVDRHRAWHIGLLESLTSSLKSRVTDDIADRIIAEAGSNPGLLDALARLVPTSSVSVPKSLPKTDAAFKSLGPALNNEVRGIIELSKQQVADVTREMEATISEMIAQSDAIHLTKGELLDPQKFDQAMDRRANWDIPQKAQSSFNSLFRPSSGLSRDINEQRLRYMGAANENVQYRAKAVQAAFKGTTARSRKADMRMFLQHGVMSPTMEAFVPMMNDILRTYAARYVVHPYGPNGVKVLGDLSRWLPDRYTLPKEVLSSEQGIGNVHQLMEALSLPKKQIDKLDPMDMAWHFMVAHEKVLAEKQILHTIADTFGIKKTGLSATTLRGPNLGYVTNKKFGDEVFFHPEISRQVDKLFDLVHSPSATNAFLSSLDKINSIYKQTVTVYNPAWHMQNVIGDTFTGWLDGVTGPRGIASYAQAGKAMALKRKMAEEFREAIHTPGANVSTTAGPRHTLFRMRNGTAISMEDTWGYYIKHGIQSGFVSTEFGIHQRGGPLGAVSKAGQPFQVAAQAQADFFRLAHFIDRMKRSKAKTADEAAQEAAEAVRKYKFDYNDFTPFEKQTLSRVIPFYKFARKNMPLMLGSLVSRPERMLRVPKALTALSVNAGFDPEGFLPDPEASSLMPEEWTDMNGWPIAVWNGETIWAKPPLPMFQAEDQFMANYPDTGQEDERFLLKNITPAISIPANIKDKKSIINNPQGTIGVYKDRGQAVREELLNYIAGSQIRTKQAADKGTGYLLDKLIGVGRPLEESREDSELSYRWKQFFDKWGEEYKDKDKRPTTRLTGKQQNFYKSLKYQLESPVLDTYKE